MCDRFWGLSVCILVYLWPLQWWHTPVIWSYTMWNGFENCWIVVRIALRLSKGAQHPNFGYFWALKYMGNFIDRGVTCDPSVWIFGFGHLPNLVWPCTFSVHCWKKLALNSHIWTYFQEIILDKGLGMQDKCDILYKSMVPMMCDIQINQNSTVGQSTRNLLVAQKT
jgi:hypothetical protein